MPDTLSARSTGTSPAKDVFSSVTAEAARAHAKKTAATAAWPSMRGDFQNRGRMRVAPAFRDDLDIRHFRTGNAIFSTPVIGADETVYVGSADHVFYAFDPVANATKWNDELDLYPAA